MNILNATYIPLQEQPIKWQHPWRGHVGMFGLIAAESAIFTIFVVAYIFYIGKSLTGPTPQEVLSAPIFYSICLLSSSVTIHLAVNRTSSGRRQRFLKVVVCDDHTGCDFSIRDSN